MKENRCRICGNKTREVFKSLVRGKHLVSYQLCDTCDFLQTETPYWQEDAYSRTITLQDTGLLRRNISLSKRVALLLYHAGLTKGRFLDYAGGYGVMTRLMRDIGFDFYWNDPYTTNLFAEGFEAEIDKSYDAITAFEFVEHSPNPMSEIQLILQYTDIFIFSTELRPETVPPREWMYYGFAHGQHIGFYSKRCLEYIAEKIGVKLFTNKKSFHVLSRSPKVRRLPKWNRLGRLKSILIQRKMSSLTVPDSRSFK